MALRDYVTKFDEGAEAALSELYDATVEYYGVSLDQFAYTKAFDHLRDSFIAWRGQVVSHEVLHKHLYGMRKAGKLNANIRPGSRAKAEEALV